MNDRELGDRLRDAGREDAEAAAAARERSWRVVRAAFDDGVAPGRRRGPRRRRWAALVAAILLVPVAVGGAAAATTPHGGVGHWVRSVLGVSEDARPALVHVPGGGRLLVSGDDGVWVVSAGGTKRRLGAYSGASWSPRGLFVVAWRDRELTALEPGGRVRWSLPRPQAVHDARWAPVDGFRIAYLTGSELRIVNGDGSGDRRFAAARGSVAPAWRPDDRHVLAYLDARDRVTVVSIDARRPLWRSARLAGVSKLAVVALRRSAARRRAPPAGALRPWRPTARRARAARRPRAARRGVGAARSADRDAPTAGRRRARRGRPARRGARPARAGPVRARPLRGAGVVPPRRAAARRLAGGRSVAVPASARTGPAERGDEHRAPVHARRDAATVPRRRRVVLSRAAAASSVAAAVRDLS